MVRGVPRTSVALLLGLCASAPLGLATAPAESSGKWFLSAAELRASVGGGFNRSTTDMQDHSDGNLVHVLLNGQAFMSRLYDELTATEAGDFIHVNFWELDGSIMLRPDSEHAAASQNTTLDTVLFAAMKRGVDVRMLISSNLYQQFEALPACRKYNKVCSGGYCCAPDNRHGNDSPAGGLGSNHEKMWIIHRRAETVAFVGSMDVADDRWDTPAHNLTNPNRTMQPQDAVRRFAWHGQMNFLRGPAVADVERTFWQRWNDPVEPYPFWSLLPPYNFSAKTAAAGVGPHSVQVVRTFSCQAGEGGDYAAFAPEGEYSFSAAFYKAIGGARDYIYLADQFMNFDEPMAAVAEALPNVKAVVLVMDVGSIDIPLGPLPRVNISQWQDTMQHYQYQALKPLLDSPYAHKVHLFSLGVTGQPIGHVNQIYVHSKTLIVDDSFALTGSTGLERVGFTNDAELSLGIWQPTRPAADPQSFAGQMRRQIWAEFLLTHVDDPLLLDPVKAVDEWVRQADEGTRRVRHYMPKQGVHPHFWPLIYGFVEPEGRCGRDPGGNATALAALAAAAAAI